MTIIILTMINIVQYINKFSDFFTQVFITKKFLVHFLQIYMLTENIKDKKSDSVTFSVTLKF